MIRKINQLDKQYGGAIPFSAMEEKKNKKTKKNRQLRKNIKRNIRRDLFPRHVFAEK